jgi:hypothetical protein
MSFRKQSSYSTNNPKELERQLIALEDAVAKSIEALEARPFFRGVQTLRGDAQVRPGYLVRCDVQGAAMTLTLATPRLEEAGFPIVVWKIGLNTLTVASPVLIGSSASIALSSTTSGYFFSTDGTTYRREF